MQLKKIVAAGSLAALMVGSSVAFAALQDLPAPFVTNGQANFLVVVGATAATDDVVGAIDVAARFGGESSSEITVGATSGGTTVTGEGKGLATTNTKVYLHDNLKKTGLRSTMTSQDLATVLNTGILKDTDANDEYKFDQYIEFSDDYNVNYTQFRDASLVEVDPDLVVVHGNRASNPSNPHNDDYFYKTRVVFQKNVNGSTAANEKLHIFGQDYTISTSTTFVAGGNNNKLVLFGSADTRVLTEKEKVTATIGGKTYDVTLNGVSDSSTVVITVGTETTSVTKGTTKTVGGLQVYVEDVFFYGSTRTDNQAKVGLGAQQLNLQHNNKVSTGSGSTTNLDGTYVNLSISSGKLNSIDVYVVPPKTSMDAMKSGGEFTDPLFGTFKVKYAGASPDLTGASRGLLEVKNSGDDALQATYTDDKGNTATFAWAYDADSIDLEDASGNKIHVSENEDIFVNEFAVLDAGDFTHFVKVSSLSNDGTTSGKVEFTDVFSGTKYDVTLGQANSTTWYLDGQAYYVNGTNNTAAVHITWGDGALLTTFGNEFTIFPVIKGRQGQYLALTRPSQNVFLGNNLNLSTQRTLWLPSGKVNALRWVEAGTARINFTAPSGYSVGTTTQSVNVTGSSSALVYVGKTATGGLWYNFTELGTNGNNITVTLRNTGNSANQAEEALVLRTEADKDNHEWNVIIPAANDSISGTVKIQAGTPDFTYDEQAIAMKTDTQKTRYLDKFGVFAERDARDQDSVKVWYPDEQMTNDILVLATGATVSSTTSSGGSVVKQTNPIKTAVAKLDTEVTNADRTGKNLILVGGPAVNTLVAELSTTGKTKNLQWYRDNGAGTALIELVDNAFTTGRSALVVAGHSAADTRAASAVVQNFDGNADKLRGVRAIWSGGSWTSETV